MKRRLQVTLDDATCDVLWRLAYEHRDASPQDAIIRLIRSAGTTRPAAAARPVGRDAKRHEAEGARAAKADEAGYSTEDVALADQTQFDCNKAFCLECKTKAPIYGDAYCLACIRDRGK